MQWELSEQPATGRHLAHQRRQRGDTQGEPRMGVNEVGPQEGGPRESCAEGPEVRGELERQLQTGGGGPTHRVNTPGVYFRL